MSFISEIEERRKEKFPADPQLKDATTITVDISKLAANPERVRKERTMNTWGLGIAGAGIGGLLGALASEGKSLERTHSITAIVVGAVILGGIGVLVGPKLKTEEEGRSEGLVKAARTGKFEEALKHEMKRREEMAEMKGHASAGAAH